ncbi:MAG: cupin-like domain-containing protein [Gemmatimonadales bacterium]
MAITTIAAPAGGRYSSTRRKDLHNRAWHRGDGPLAGRLQAVEPLSCTCERSPSWAHCRWPGVPPGPARPQSGQLPVQFRELGGGCERKAPVRRRDRVARPERVVRRPRGSQGGKPVVIARRCTMVGCRINGCVPTACKGDAMTGLIPRISWPVDRTEFEARFVHGSRPVIITGWVGVSPPCQRLTFDVFRDRYGDRVLRVNRQHAVEWRPDDLGYDSLTVAQLVDEVLSPDTVRSHFAVQVPILEKAPWLLDDLELPPVIETRDLVGYNFWMQPAKATTHLHWDGHPGLLALHRGEKRVVLYSPEQHPLLYPTEPNAATVNWSRVNVLAPDLSDFPLFRDVRPLEGVIAEGEMLFIPRFWWHFVLTSEASIGVNCWWEQRVPSTATYELFYRDRTVLARAKGASTH